MASGAAGRANAGLCPASSSLFFCRVLLQYIKLLMLQVRICAIVNVLSYRIASCQPFMLAGLRLSLQPMRLFLPTRRYASAATSYGPVFVRLSVCHKSVFYQNGWTDWASFWHRCIFRPILQRVLNKFRYLEKNKWHFPSLWKTEHHVNTMVKKPTTPDFLGHIDRRNVLST